MIHSAKKAIEPWKLKTIDMELALSAHFGVRRNLIVPNVSWGAGLHECDLLILSQAGYATEVEIKISRSDLVRDKLKRHGHRSSMIKSLYFAIPDYLESQTHHIPLRAGILLVGQDCRVRCTRPPKSYSAHKYTYAERFQIARLGALRIWGLKRNLQASRKEIHELLRKKNSPGR